jgi:hypothetical protein
VAALGGLSRGCRGQILARAVRGEDGHAEERVAFRDRLEPARGEPPLAVEDRERPRLVEEPFPEPGRGERRGGTVRAGSGGDAFPQRMGLLAQESHELAPRRPVVEPDEADEAERHRGHGQDQESASAGGRHVRELRPSGAGEDLP